MEKLNSKNVHTCWRGNIDRLIDVGRFTRANFVASGNTEQILFALNDISNGVL